MNAEVRCTAADSIFANNVSRKLCTKYGYIHFFRIEEKR